MRKIFTINSMRTTEEFDTYLALLKNKVYDGVEIFYPYEVDDRIMETYTKNVKRLHTLNIEMVMHLPFGTKNDLCDKETYEQVIVRLKNALDYGTQFAIKKYTLHLGYIHTTREEAIVHIIEVLKELATYAYPKNLMIENMPNDKHIGYSPDEILFIIDQVKASNIKFILDVGHAHVSPFDILDYIRLLRPYLYHFHIHDNDGSGDQHARFGKGTIDFPRFLRELKDYQEYYCLEIIYKNDQELIENAQAFDAFENL